MTMLKSDIPSDRLKEDRTCVYCRVLFNNKLLCPPVSASTIAITEENAVRAVMGEASNTEASK